MEDGEQLPSDKNSKPCQSQKVSFIAIVPVNGQSPLGCMEVSFYLLHADCEDYTERMPDLC